MYKKKKRMLKPIITKLWYEFYGKGCRGRGGVAQRAMRRLGLRKATIVLLSTLRTPRWETPPRPNLESRPNFW